MLIDQAFEYVFFVVKAYVFIFLLGFINKTRYICTYQINME